MENKLDIKFDFVSEKLLSRVKKLITHEAFNEVRKKIEEDPDGYQGIYYAAQRFKDLKEFDIACVFFEETLKRSPGNIFAYSGLGTCWYNQFNIERANECFHVAVANLIRYEFQNIMSQGKRPHLQDTSIDVEMFLTPKNVLIFGDTILEQDEWMQLFFPNKSSKEIEKSISADPESKEAVIFNGFQESLAHAFYCFGNKCREMELLDDAIVSFKLAIRLQPIEPIYQTNLGTALLENEDYNNAQIELTKAIILDPNDAIAYNGMGAIYAKIGQLNRAIEYFSKANELKRGAYDIAIKNLELMRSQRTINNGDKSVFLSYASEDKEFVLKLAEDLGKNGIFAWVDDWSIAVGDSITTKINKAFQENRFYIPVLSQNFLNKPFPMKELNVAMMKQARSTINYIIPIIIEDCTIPALLLDLNYLNFYSNYESALKKLLFALTTKDI